MNNGKPNILIIFTDMQRADTIAALGNPNIKTPNLDRLVNEGTSFTNCYSPSPVCIPARCCMHYGLYPQKTGLYINGVMMNDNNKSYPELLGKNGYYTHSIGKRHFTPDSDARRGFHSIERQEEGRSNPEKDDYVKWLSENGYDYFEPHGARGEMYYIPQIASNPVKAHPSNWIGDRSINFIEKAENQKRPWLLFSSFIHPHPPFSPPKPWHKLYRAPLMPLPKVPENSESLQTWINRYQNRYKYRDQGIDRNLIRNIKAYYYATISFVDWQIGRIIKSLEKTGQLENTMIIFSSDHGEYLGDYNCFGKRSMHDASSRVPLIVRYPEKFPAGKKCGKAVSLIDIMPTIAAASGTSLTDVEHDGTDLAEIIEGKTERQFVFSQYSQKETGIYMAVSSEWKYFYSAADRMEYLFNKKTDPDETRNIAGLVFMKNKKDEIKQLLLDFLKKNNKTDAYMETEDGLEWKQYPPHDENYLNDPDSKLLIQDHHFPHEITIDGYTD
jgi:arylsulfatase A-like enzyme